MAEDTEGEFFCKCCNKLIGEKTKSIGCDGCAEWYLLECVNISVRQFNVITSITSLKWFCAKCCREERWARPDPNEVMLLKDIIKEKEHLNLEKDKRLNLQDDMINVLKQKPNDLNLLGLGLSERSAAKSYADIAGPHGQKGRSGRNQWKELSKPESPGIYIESCDPESRTSYAKVKETIMAKVDPKKLGVGIVGVNPSKNGVIIKCDSEESRNILKAEADKVMGAKYKVGDEKKSLQPRILVYNVLKNLVPENEDKSLLVENIVKQNNLELNNLNVSVKIITIVPDRRDNRKVKLVLEVDPKTRSRLVGDGKLKMEWAMLNVTDYIHVTRCFKCAGYGHVQKDCKNEVTCPVCAGGHEKRECNADEVKCVNCCRANERLNLRLNVFHTALSWECECYKRKYRQLQSKINYEDQIQI